MILAPAQRLRFAPPLGTGLSAVSFGFIPLCSIPQKDAAPIPGAGITANLGVQPFSSESISFIFLFFLPIRIGYFFQEDFLFTVKQYVSHFMKESKPETFFTFQSC
jgi:hypothetical protein